MEKRNLTTVLTSQVIITLVIVGGVTAWQKNNSAITEDSFQQQIQNVQIQIAQLKQKQIAQLKQELGGIRQLLVDQNRETDRKNLEESSSDRAQKALLQYFELLNKKRYDDALKYHGAGFEVLHDMNPDENRNAYALLLKLGCENNGFNCLRIRKVLEKKRVSDNEFKFRVQFLNRDGGLFQQGPCCGETEEDAPTRSNFEYTVKKSSDSYTVMELPIYTP